MVQLKHKEECNYGYNWIIGYECTIISDTLVRRACRKQKNITKESTPLFSESLKYEDCGSH